MKTDIKIVYPLVLRNEQSAFQKMIALYASFNDPKLNFWDDLTDYIENGYVRISPSSMGMAKPCRDEKGDYWFIRAAIGGIEEVAAMLPFYLPRIMWCRRNDGFIREYKTDRVLKLVASKMKRK